MYDKYIYPCKEAATRAAASAPPPPKHLDVCKGALLRLPEPLSDQFLGLTLTPNPNRRADRSLRAPERRRAGALSIHRYITYTYVDIYDIYMYTRV